MVSFMRKAGIAVFAIIIVFCLGLAIFHLKFKIYFELLDSKRCVINCCLLIALMILHIVSSVMAKSLGTGLSIVILSYLILLIVLIVNVLIFILLTRRQLKR
jgi:hypothetical protein